MLPAQIWDDPEAIQTPTGFRIPGKHLVEEHVRRGVIEVGPPPRSGQTNPIEHRTGRRLWLGSCGSDDPWVVAATLEEWVTFAGREDYAWVSLGEPIMLPITVGGRPRAVRRALVAARHPGWDLGSAHATVHIRICRPVDGRDHGSRFDPGDIMAEVWGLACPTQAEALQLAT